MTSKRILLRGDPEAVRRALDWCHVHLEVLGVLEDVESVELAIRGRFDRAALPHRVEVEFLPEVPVRTGLEDDGPIAVGERILIRPPWVPQPPRFQGLTLVVPRGGAFGSGEHGSTRAALLALDAAWPATDGVFADIGTGSGVLALFARARGAHPIVACDLDAPSVAAARALVPEAHVFRGGAAALAPKSASTLVANLSGTELAAALEDLRRAWEGGGPLVLSGMRCGEVGPIAGRIPVAPAGRVEVDGFVALTYAGRGA